MGFELSIQLRTFLEKDVCGYKHYLRPMCIIMKYITRFNGKGSLEKISSADLLYSRGVHWSWPPSRRLTQILTSLIQLPTPKSICFPATPSMRFLKSLSKRTCFVAFNLVKYYIVYTLHWNKWNLKPLLIGV